MIFRTITDDITGANKSIGLFGLSLQNVKNKLQEIQAVGFKNAIFNSSTIDTSAIIAYNNEISKGATAQQALATASRNTNRATIALMQSTNGATVSTEQLAAAQQASTLSSKALSMAIKTVSVAMNMIAFALIAKGIQLAADAIDHYVNRAKYAAEALEEAQQKIDKTQNSLKELSDTLEENRDRFLELSEGVDRFSHNLTLSEEEYSEYLSISQKLAELSPSLISGYDEQGNALLDIGNSAEETTSKLNGLLETQHAIAQQTLIDNMDTVADGIYYEVEEAKNKIGAFKTELENLENTNVEIDIFKTADMNAGKIEFVDDGSIDNKYYEGMEKALTSAGIKFEKGGLGSAKHFQILEASPEQFENAQKFYDAMLEQERAYYSAKKAGLEKDIKEQEDIISNSYSKMSANLQAWAKDNYDYQYLSNPMQSVIDIAIPEIDWASMGDDAPKNAFEYQDYIQKHFIDPLMAVPENEKPKINSMFQKLLDFEPGDIDVVPFAEYLENELKNLGIEINLTPIVSDEQSTYNNLQKSMSDAAQKASGATDGEITSKSGRYNDYKAIYDKIEAFAKEYEIDTTEEAKAFDEALNRANGNIEKAFEYYLNRKTEDISLSFTENLSEVQKLSKGLDQIDKIYADVYDKEDFDWSSILNNEDFAEEFGNMQNVTDEYKDAYENFIKTVSNSPDDLNACQSAFDDLATAYIYNSGVLDKVTEETKDATIAFLEQKGVINAEEVVLASLSGKEEAHALKEKALAITKDEVTDKTQDEINAFLDEANASETARNWLFKLITAEQVFNNQELDVSSKIKNLEALARAYGSTASAAAMSARLAYMKEQAEKSHITFNPTAADLADLQSEIDEALFKPVEIEYGGGSATKSAKDKSSSKEDKQSKETIDFIEIAIKRIEEAIDKLKTKAENTFIGFEVRAKHYTSLLGKVTDEINLQSQAYQAYMARANSVGLSEVYASQVRDGSLNIVDITDDKLKEQIKDYQTWYEKAKECQDKVEELKITQIELTQANLELLITKYEKLAEKVSSANDRIQGKLDLKEAWGFHATSGSYTSMNKNIIKQIDYIKKQDEELKKLLNTVEKGSEAWLEYQARLDDNKKSLQDLTKEMAENAKAAAELSGAKAERKVEKYDKSDEKLDAKIDNSIKYKNQNKYLNTEMNNIDRRQKAYDKAVETDKKGIATTSKAINKTKSNKENKSILKKIKSLVKQKKKISESLLKQASKLGDNGVLYNKCVRYNAYISAYEIDKDIADLYRETSQHDKADIAQRKLDNIQTYYKNRQGENNQKAEQLNARIEMAKESGYVESATLYNQLSSVEKQNNASLRAERDKLQESLAKSLLDGSIKKNSDEWYEMCQQIDDVTNEIDQSDLALKQYQNTLRQMKWDSFDYLQGKISNVTSEMDFMINELSREDLTSDDIGGLTDEGNGVAYLRASKYETLKNQLADYYAELETLEKTEDQYDTKVIERKEELRQRIQDTTSAVQDEKWAIIDLYTQGYEALSNKIKDLIDEYGELLDAEKEAYDWQNTIADKTKEIASIRKQLSAYANDSSEETKAKIQQLNVSLEEAEKDLKDSQYDKFISDTKDMLSDLQEDMDNNIQSIIDNLDKNFDELMASIGENATTSAETVKSAMTGIGYQPSEDFSTMLSTTLEGSSIKASVDKMITGIDNLVEILKKRAEENAKGADTTTASEDVKKEAISKQQGKVDTKKEKYEKALEEYNKAKKETSKLKTKMDDIGWIYGIDSKKYKNANEKYKQAKKNRDTLKSSMNSAKKEYEDELSELEKLKKYSVGSKHITKDQLAWTQDGGQELVYRSNDGAILTRLGEGDKVFTNEMSENLWKLAQLHPADFMNGIGNVKLPDVTRNVTGGDVRIEFGDLVLPDVTNSAEFANSVEGVMRNAICKNGKTAKCFTEAVSSMQMGRGIGNARLYK